MKKVDVYSTPTCMYCNLTKEFLTDKGVEYTEHNVADDEEKRNYVIERSGQMGVPVTIITSEDGTEADPIVGFDEAALSEALGLAAT